ncbi:MAG: hypothetical protein WCW78_03625 [Candidatus Paceibacterota bacterium]|jgi:hypothetical protein
MMTAQEKIAKILRVDKDYILTIEKRFSAATGKTGVFERMMYENEVRIKDRLERLELSGDVHAKEVFDALIVKVEASDVKLCAGIGTTKCTTNADFVLAVEAVKKVAKIPKGFFLKKEKAIELLTNEPPKKVMAYLGYATVAEMLAKEDIVEILAALRFVEGNEWLNKAFFTHYEKLTPNDFEEREVEVRALSPKWSKYAKIFVMKKWHNVSHLKEFGILFVIPVSLGISGELLRMMTLIYHYTHEIPFYSDMFREIAKNPKTFPEHLISLLRGDTIDDQKLFAGGETSRWLVIQRYLTKDDENDWRLSVPHINPEAIHWEKAEEDLETSGNLFSGTGNDLKFWRDLDWVGDYFKDEMGNDILVSFDLVDTVMSLVKRHEDVRFLYHHQEALWNEVFMQYFSRKELEEYSKKHLIRGYFEI